MGKLYKIYVYLNHLSRCDLINLTTFRFLSPCFRPSVFKLLDASDPKYDHPHTRDPQICIFFSEIKEQKLSLGQYLFKRYTFVPFRFLYIHLRYQNGLFRYKHVHFEK